MKRSDLPFLACPGCHSNLTISESREVHGNIHSASLSCQSCGRSYQIVNSVPRFVPPENYATNFGFQWNTFSKTQLDSYTGLSISRERFFRSTGWTPDEMKGKLVLDVGCGAGRFAEIALSTGAHVVALDYSSAVDACAANLGSNENLRVIQADVYSLPFRPAQFDFVYCLGVLQHTPDPRATVHALCKQLRVGGKITVDVYPSLWLNLLWPKYWLRPATKRLDQKRLLAVVERLTPGLLRISQLIARIPIVGAKLRWLVPVVNHQPNFPQLSADQNCEWAILDTFDMFSPAYDKPQTIQTIAAWLRESGLTDVNVFRWRQNIGRARRQSEQDVN
jgi:SAM-dependent methyltransferase